MGLQQKDLNILKKKKQKKVTLNKFMKMIEAFKVEMKISLKEIEKETSKKLEESGTMSTICYPLTDRPSKVMILSCIRAQFQFVLSVHILNRSMASHTDE